MLGCKKKKQSSFAGENDADHRSSSVAPYMSVLRTGAKMTWDSPRTSMKSPLWAAEWAPIEGTLLLEACWSVPCTWPCSACASASFIQKELFSVVEHHAIPFVNHNSVHCRSFRFLELLASEAGSTYCHTSPLKATYPLHLHGVLGLPCHKSKPLR